jgi:hypothetical protein
MQWHISFLKSLKIREDQKNLKIVKKSKELQQYNLTQTLLKCVI